MARAVLPAVIHALDVALTILVITAGCLAAAALVATGAVVAVRLRRRQLAVRPPVRLVSSRPARALPASRPQAIERPAARLHFHRVSAEDVAAILRAQDQR